MTLLAWSAGACLEAFIVGLLVAVYGTRIGLVDVPSGRSSHSKAMPRAGGLGIVVAGVVAAAVCGLSAAAWLPMAGIGALGLADDRWHVESYLRLAVQCLLAVVGALWLLRETVIPLTLELALGILFVLILVGTSNIYNFMDGSNGMAGLMGVVAFGMLAVLSLAIAKDVEIGEIAVIIAAACCGFLPLNLRRTARVFMGDVCSTFLGFTAALLALQLWMERPIWGLCALGSLTVFYVDAGWTLLARLHRHERLFEAHRTHAYQRLVNELGWTHLAVAVAYAWIQGATGMVLFVASRWGFVAVAEGVAAVVIVLSWLYWHIEQEAARRT